MAGAAAAVYRGVETLMRKSKVKGPVSQLIDYWNNVSAIDVGHAKVLCSLANYSGSSSSTREACM